MSTSHCLRATFGVAMLQAAILTGGVLVAADNWEKRFGHPPDEARPLTWWHWLDGTITRDGITADWEAIKRAGLGGAYLFNCGVGMPRGDVKFMQPEWLAMMDHTIKEAERLISWPDHSDPGIRHFSGAATYERKGVLIPADLLTADRELYLDLGQVAVIAAVKLNGQDLGTFWKPPFCLRINGTARPGANDLEIRVINLWPNRMIGDASWPDDIQWNEAGRRGAYPAQWPAWLLQGQPRPSKRVTFCTRQEVYAKDDPLLPSGLLGPVTLRTAEQLLLK